MADDRAALGVEAGEAESVAVVAARSHPPPRSLPSNRVKKRSRSAAVDTIAPAAHADLAVRSLVSVRLPVAMPSRSGRS